MRTLLVEGDKTFKIDIPDDAIVTFGPWSPPGKGTGGAEWRNDPGNKRGTLRVYRNIIGKGKNENVIGVFTNVQSFRDLSEIQYTEQVAKEEGATIWKSDQNGYERNENIARRKEWVSEPHMLPAKTASKKKKTP